MTQEQAPERRQDDDVDPIKWPDPTPEMLNTPEFEAIWQCIKNWNIGVPDMYSGYCVTGNHVRTILDALSKAPPAGMRTVREWASLILFGDERFVPDKPNWDKNCAIPYGKLVEAIERMQNALPAPPQAPEVGK